MSAIQLAFSLSLNVISSVGVIFINKRLVFQASEFHFGTALTIIHFIVTFFGCLFFANRGLFEIKPLEIRRVLSISLAFSGYVVFNNLSLLTNSVALYQIAKILCTPVIVGIEYFNGRKESKSTLASLVVVCLGILITVYAETKISFVGIFWATLAIAANSFYTVWGKTKQNELNVTPMQILTYQAPISALTLMICQPLMDPFIEFLTFHYTPTAIGSILLSCVFAFGVNFSFFLFVGLTSPLTVNVLGYLKTCLVFLGGFLFFEDKPTGQSILGITVAMIGLALYTKSKMNPTPVSKSSSTFSKDQDGLSKDQEDGSTAVTVGSSPVKAGETAFPVRDGSQGDTARARNL